MATTVASLMATLGLDSSDFNQGIDSAERKSDKLGTALRGLSSIGAGILAAGFATAATGAVLLGKEIFHDIGLASNLAETISKTSVVFGDSADDIMEWSKTSANSLGLSQNAALTATATYGNLFRAMNIGEKESADMSMGLVNLSGDLASFNNMDPTVVLDKLRAGLSGETEPLKSLGININETILKEKALELGIYDGIDALTASQKAHASYALIMEQTTLAQGDFARTSQGAANQQRILQARIEDIRTAFGKKFEPTYTKILNQINDFMVKPEVMEFVDTLGDKISTFLTNAIDKLPIFFNNIKMAFGWLMENQGVIIAAVAVISVAILAFFVTLAAAAWTAMAPLLPVVAVILLIAGAAYLLYQAWINNFGGIQEKTAAVWAVVQPILQNLIAWVQRNLPVAIQFLGVMWNNMLASARLVWGFLSTYIIPLLQAIAKVIVAVVMNSFRQWSALIQNVIVPALKSLYAWFEENILPALKRFAAFAKADLAPVFVAVGRAIEGTIGWLSRLADSINSLTLPAWLTPGSPTPFELGLLGIKDAMRKVNAEGLPMLSAGINTSGDVNVGAGASGNVFNINVSSQGILDEKDIARKIGAAVGVILREKGLA